MGARPAQLIRDLVASLYMADALRESMDRTIADLRATQFRGAAE